MNANAVTPAIRFSGITKRFPGLTALRDVSFDIAAGTCHAICGENGAGKSTLGKILAGIFPADEGAIELDGHRVSFDSPRDALASGVAMVHQELAFCDNMTVAENLCLGKLPNRFFFVNEHALRDNAARLLQGIGARIDPDRPMAELSVAEQQLVQIAAAVGEGARVIIFDEPTSSLGEAEANALYRLIGELRTKGVTLLFVSHRMPEIFRLCDSVTVLRDGQHVATQPAASLDESALVQLMIGRKLEQYFPEHAGKERGPERLRVEQLSSPGKFQDVSFSVHAGEVVGLAGLVGAGRSEIAQAIFGLDAQSTGRIMINGRAVIVRTAQQAMQQRIGFVPEDRKRQGLVLSMRSRENATLPIINRFAKLGWIDRNAEAASVATHFERLRVKATPESITGTLSGGNQQKIVMSKWLAADSDILILDEPTRGVDVGAKAELHAWIDKVAAQGAAVLLISSELPELLNVSSRILVLRNGRLHGEISREHATQESVLRLMSGLGTGS